VVAISIALSGALAKAAHAVIILPLFIKGKNEELALITSLSLALSFVFFLYSIYSIYLRFFKKQKSIVKNYIFNKDTGIYTHKKTGQMFCGRCMVEGVESPLITLQYGWFCQRKGCSRSYSDPDNPRPKPQREVISRGENTWLNRSRRW
jgi:hypothetical protein